MLSFDTSSNATLTGTLTGTTATFVGDGDIITAQRGTFTVKTSLTSVNHNILSTGKAFNFGTTDSQGLFFMTNNSVGMNLDSSGRLLINTTSTAFSDKLYVNSDAYTTGGWRVGSGATFVGKMFNSSGKLTIQSDSNRDLQFGDSNNADIMYIDTSEQRVGINTSSPTSPLQVDGTIFINGSSLKITSSGVTNYYDAVKMNSYGTVYDWKFSGSNVMRINSSGRLLIGTTTDSGHKLQISGGNGNQLKITSGNVAWDANIDLDTGDTNGLWRIKAEGSDETFRITNVNQGGTAPFTIHPTTKTTTLGGSLTGTNATFSGNLLAETYRSSRTDGDIYIQAATASDFVAIGTQVSGQANLMRVRGNGNVLIGTTTDSGAKLYVNGVIRAVGGGIQAAQDYGFTLNDESGSNRYGLKFGAAGTVGGSNLLMLTNRSFNSATGGGEVAIGGNTNTSGVSEVEIARFKPRVAATSGTQKKVSLDAVLELTEQTAPANPEAGKSIIWMDSESGDLKVKLNYGGTTVTRVLAAFEG